MTRGDVGEFGIGFN